MEYFETNGKFPGERINLPRTPFHLYLFIFHNIWAGLLYTSLLNHCVMLYGSSVVLTFIACIGFMSKSIWVSDTLFPFTVFPTDLSYCARAPFA